MGKIVATYLVKVTLRQRDDLPSAVAAPAGSYHAESEPPIPTLEDLERFVKEAIYDNTPYYTDDEIGVSSERTDI